MSVFLSQVLFELDDCEEEMTKMSEYARKAVAAGNDNEARQFLSRKAELAEKQTVLAKNYEMACENSAKMRQMHDKLQADIASLKSRRDMLKAKARVAETQKKIFIKQNAFPSLIPFHYI